MAEALVEGAGRTTAPAPGQPWWEWLAERARLQWRALTSHRDAALVSAIDGEGLDDLRLAELFEGRKAPRAAMPALAW